MNSVIISFGKQHPILKWLGCYVIGFLLMHSAGFAKTNADNIQVLRRYYELYQMWATSRDYQYGGTRSKDPVRAYAWLINYTDSLPKNYPGKNKIENNLKNKLDQSQLTAAKQKAAEYKKKYHLNFSLTEKDLLYIFKRHSTKEAFHNSLIEGKQEFSNFNEMLSQIQAGKQALTAKELLTMRDEFLKDTTQLAYGRLFIDGIEPNQFVNSPMFITEAGYFIGPIYPNQKEINFKLNGYETKKISIKPNEPLLNLGNIVLKPLMKQQKAGIVGQVLPAADMSNTHIMLKIKPPKDMINLAVWHDPVIPVTVLADGEFYATDLTPGDYELTIVRNNHKKQQSIKLSAGITKGIPAIRMP